MDCRHPGLSVHGILQVRMLEWVAIPFFGESFQPRDRTQISCTTGTFFTTWATVALFYTSNKLNHCVFPKTVCETDYCLIFSPWLNIMERKSKKANWLSGEALQIAVKRREMKSKGEKEIYKHLNAEFQTIARRDKKAFLSDQCKEIEENNRMGKTRDLFKKSRDTNGTFHAKMGSIKPISVLTEMVWT